MIISQLYLHLYNFLTNFPFDVHQAMLLGDFGYYIFETNLLNAVKPFTCKHWAWREENWFQNDGVADLHRRSTAFGVSLISKQVGLAKWMLLICKRLRNLFTCYWYTNFDYNNHTVKKEMVNLMWVVEFSRIYHEMYTNSPIIVIGLMLKYRGISLISSNAWRSSFFAMTIYLHCLPWIWLHLMDNLRPNANLPWMISNLSLVFCCLQNFSLFENYVYIKSEKTIVI